MDDVQAVKQTYVIALENEEDTSMVVHTLIHADFYGIIFITTLKTEKLESQII
jgi:hypothetical protein